MRDQHNEWYEPLPPPDPDAILYDDEELPDPRDIPDWDEPLESLIGVRRGTP